MRHREEERGVIVTHRVVLKLIVLFAIGLNVSHFWNVKLDTCSISTIEFDGNTYTLSGLNRNAHLRGDAGPENSTRADF
jgi:broad specificity phosphatase PhoE